MLNVNNKTSLLIALLIWAFSFSLYYPALSFDFVYIDVQNQLLNHPLLFNAGSFSESLYQIFIAYFPREPLIIRDISWALDSYFFSFKNPFGYHLGNVILNSFNAVLVFIFLLINTHRFLFSLLITITFIVLPIHAEPVAWVMGRKDLLVAFFMLLGLIFNTYFITIKDHKKWYYYGLTLLCTACAIMSKLGALPFFIVLFLHQLLYPALSLKPVNISLKRVGTITLSLIPHVIIIYLFYAWYKSILVAAGILAEGDLLGWENIKNVLFINPFIIYTYIKATLLPYQNLLYFYGDINYLQRTTELPLMVLFIANYIALPCLLIWTWCRNKICFFYLFTCLVLLIPYFSIYSQGIHVANRYFYLPSLFLITFFFYFVDTQVKAKPLIVVGLISWALWLFMVGYKNHQFLLAWENKYALWRYEYQREDPSNYAVVYYVNNEIELVMRGVKPRATLDELIPIIDKAIANQRDSKHHEQSKLYYSLYIIAKLKSNDQAHLILLKAYQHNPNDILFNEKLAEYYFNLGLLRPSEQRLVYINKSFDYYAKSIYLSYLYPSTKKKHLKMLRQYEYTFPEIAHNVELMRQYILRK